MFLSIYFFTAFAAVRYGKWSANTLYPILGIAIF